MQERCSTSALAMELCILLALTPQYDYVSLVIYDFFYQKWGDMVMITQ